MCCQKWQARGAGRGGILCPESPGSRARREQDSLYKKITIGTSSAPVQGALGSIPGQELDHCN